MCDQCMPAHQPKTSRPYRRVPTIILRRVLDGELQLGYSPLYAEAELAQRPSNAAERELAGRMPNGQGVRW